MELKPRGRRAGVIRRDAHRFDIDHPGKNSCRLAAGADTDTMLISSQEKLAMVKKHESSPPLDSVLCLVSYDFSLYRT